MREIQVPDDREPLSVSQIMEMSDEDLDARISRQIITNVEVGGACQHSNRPQSSPNGFCDRCERENIYRELARARMWAAREIEAHALEEKLATERAASLRLKGYAFDL